MVPRIFQRWQPPRDSPQAGGQQVPPGNARRPYDPTRASMPMRDDPMDDEYRRRLNGHVQAQPPIPPLPHRYRALGHQSAATAHELMDDGHGLQRDHGRPPSPEEPVSVPMRYEPEDTANMPQLYGQANRALRYPRGQPVQPQVGPGASPDTMRVAPSSNTVSKPMHDEVIRRLDAAQRLPTDEPVPQPTWTKPNPNIDRGAGQEASPLSQAASPRLQVVTPTIEVREADNNTLVSQDGQGPEGLRIAFSHSRQASSNSNLRSPDTTSRVWSPRSPVLSGASSPPLSVSDFRPRLSTASSVGYLGDKYYIYSPLGPNEIRLVKILPARKSAVQCEIVHADLDHPPTYFALSYAWGDTMDTKKIQMDGNNISVTSSLHGALVALRTKDDPVLLWVDALSINQQDGAERTEQVKLMTKIYGSASQVAIWLGPEADDSSLSLEFLRELNHATGSAHAVEELLRSPDKAAAIAATVALFERDYWQRLWIVQEVLKARNAVVCCGSARLSWAKCYLSRDIFAQYRSEIDRQFPGGFGGSKRKQVESQNQLSYSQVLIHYGPGSLPALKQRPSLLQILRACRKKLSFDPRDKVFGLLGIMPDNMRQDFRIDYELSVKEVYTDVVDIILHATDRLDVICEAIHFPLHTSAHRLPTWVPDWSHSAQVTALGLSFDFNASKDTKVSFDFDGESRNRLGIKAIFLDYVASHGVSVGTFCTTADFLMAFVHWRAILLGSDLLGPDVKDSIRRTEVHNAFCRTLCLAQVPQQWKTNWTEIVYHIFSKMLSTRLPYLPLDGKLAEYINWDYGVPPEQHRGLMHQHIGARMRGRTFCMTKNGLLGMGTGFMAPGDEIIVPFGCRTPIIVRREGSRGEYRLVGDAYIDGFMDGNAIDQWKQGVLQSKKYVLH